MTPAESPSAPRSVRGAVRGPYDITRNELGHQLADQPAYRTGQVWQALYEQGLRPEEMTTLPKTVRERLDSALPAALRTVTESVSEDGQTVKWLSATADAAAIETVLMLYPDRATVCVSSQAGCAMNCSFCATGQAGFRRHLSTGEILEQVAKARRRAAPRRLSNIVFMGMGEPLANYDRVWAAVERIHTDMGISARHITISTVGVIAGIRRLSRESLPVNLAVSLHAANDQLRNQLVPLNRRHPLDELVEACRQYLTAKNRRLSFEWALISGVNDRPADARELATIAVPLGAHVNLIPLNPTPGYAVRGTDKTGVRLFREELNRLGVNATVRRNRGTDIDAACGQLAGSSTVLMSPTRVSSEAVPD
ncbi:MAG TPA: 23S rRNA (adenine(2503)-C(2))-methyltransferase RlmN [Acidimicrobiales bacterium]|jgi:23S rRNA (adenine2503-C2)-methyltransferase|nr:23S rRNA (adenine(2503)-C(2))-methyltransferase RlmN [Acidimicrobiales bacterium]